MTSVLHVAPAGSDLSDGSQSAPSATIARAAELAQPGDRVVVHEGEYREWVKPRRGGLSDARRITYEAAAGEHVVIKGSERVTDWEQLDGWVWTVTVPNALFGSFNPFAEEVVGDWVVRPIEPGQPASTSVTSTSTGAASTRWAAPTRSWSHVAATRSSTTGRPARSPSTTPTRRGTCGTHRWAPTRPPSGRTSTRRTRTSDSSRSTSDGPCSTPPSTTSTTSPFAASSCARRRHPWAPPTADQPGLIGPNWAKGWVIEDNVIHDAKCVAISIGKEASTGDNNYTHRGDKPGYQYQLESVFSAREIGWDKEHIGSHVIRRNTIYDCGQCAVAGHLGCVFSTIEDNHIHRIALKREFYGHEIAGIKLHAAIDVEITHNRIHSCSLGIWLDWQTQGTRVARNVLYGNSRDLFVEVSHGPYVVDHNVLASPVSIESFSQGGAYVGNLVCGTLGLIRVMDRATPYHRPHSTQVAGYAVIYGADDRWIGNVFAGGEVDAAYNTDAHTYDGAWVGTAGYDGHPSTFEDYLALIDAQPPGDHNRFPDVPQAVYIRHNAYAGAATPYAAEDAPLRLDSASFTVVEEGDTVFLDADLPESFDGLQVGVVTGADLPGSASSTRTSRSVTAHR